jgi:hypothetical protein
VLDVLAGHAVIVGDLIDLIVSLGAGEDSGPAQLVPAKMPSADEGVAFAFFSVAAGSRNEQCAPSAKTDARPSELP